MKNFLKIFAMIVLMAFGEDLFSQSQPIDSILQRYDRHWEMQPGLYRVMKEGKVGVVDDRGKVIVPCRFNQVWAPSKGNYIRVLLNMKTGLYHLEKGIILPAEYDQIWEFESGLAKVMKNRKFGFVDSEGMMVVPCEYQHVWSPRNNRIKVIKDGLTGYIGVDGQIVVPAIYQHIWDFENGMSRVIRDGKMGYVDEQGNEVVPAVYDQVWSFEGEEALVMRDGEFFKINKSGNVVSEVDHPAPRDVNEESKSAAEKEQLPRISIQKDYIDIRHDGRDIHISKNKKRRSRFEGHLEGVALGMNGYLNSSGNEELPAGYGFMELNQGKSLEVSVYPIQESLRLIGGWFGLTAGVGLQYNNYRFNLESINDIDEGGLGQEWFPEISQNASISKSKLMLMHANVPLLAEIQIPDRQNHNSFFLSGGVIGGVRLQTHTKLVFHDDGGRQKKKKRDDMGISTFRYGYMARAGYGNFSLYGTYYPEPIFKSGEGPELYPFSLGVMFIFD